MTLKLMFVLLAAFTVFLTLSADQGQDEADDVRELTKAGQDALADSDLGFRERWEVQDVLEHDEVGYARKMKKMAPKKQFRTKLEKKKKEKKKEKKKKKGKKKEKKKKKGKKKEKKKKKGKKKEKKKKKGKKKEKKKGKKKGKSLGSSARWEGDLCATHCGFWTCTYYKCLGDSKCCSRSKDSRCCPTSHPVCIGDKCCPSSFPRLCGSWCCTSSSYCCNNRACCSSRDSCCGSSCCATNYRCCGDKCCNKDTKACCDGRTCTDPCPSQFDVLDCYTIVRYLVAAAVEYKRDVPDKLYRILRSDEDPAGIVAKDPSQTRTVLSHINCGSRRGYKSQYISTSASIQVSRRYKEKGEEQGLQGLRICEFDTNTVRDKCTIHDLTTDANRDHYLGNAVCKNFAKASEEIVLECREPIPCMVVE